MGASSALGCPGMLSSLLNLWTCELSLTEILKMSVIKVLVTQSCLTLCNPVDYRPTGSSIHGIFWARILEWVAIRFSRGFSQSKDQTQVSCIADRFFTMSEPSEIIKCNLQSLILLIRQLDQIRVNFISEEDWFCFPIHLCSLDNCFIYPES